MSEQLDFFSELFEATEAMSFPKVITGTTIASVSETTTVKEQTKASKPKDSGLTKGRKITEPSSDVVSNELSTTGDFDFEQVIAKLSSASSIEEEIIDPTNDVRTEVQRNQKKVISYDVGEKIGGARKDIEEWKRKFLEKPDSSTLKEIADIDNILATELATKNNVFGWFNMEGLFNKGVEIRAAYGMSLLIRRLPTNSKNLDREKYMNSLLFISDEFQRISTFNQLQTTISRFSMLVMSKEQGAWQENVINPLEKEIEMLVEEKNTYNKEVDVEILRATRRLRLAFCSVYALAIKENFYFEHFGSFTELLLDKKNQKKRFRESSLKYSSWTDYFEDNKEKTKKRVSKGANKPVWERELPVEPKRMGGREVIDIRKPEEFCEYFGFRAVEFGNWMTDDYGRAHLVNSARALVDLSDLLDLDVQHVSLGNELAFAFGARGKGRALGHYERSYNVINLTKEKGSLGIAAHEWWHAYDRFLKKVLATTDHMELLTEGNNLHEIPSEVLIAYYELMREIKEGESTAYFEINPLNRYHIRSSAYEEFDKVNGDLQQFVDTRMRQFDELVERALDRYTNDSLREKAKIKYAKNRLKELRKNCEVAAQVNKERTGKDVYLVPYTTPHTQFYLTAIELDRKKVGKYWSSNVELTARAFEAYISSKLEERGMRSDYLVYGIDYAYPQKEERYTINNAMDKFLQVTLPYLRKTT